MQSFQHHRRCIGKQSFVWISSMSSFRSAWPAAEWIAVNQSSMTSIYKRWRHSRAGASQGGEFSLCDGGWQNTFSVETWPLAWTVDPIRGISSRGGEALIHSGIRPGLFTIAPSIYLSANRPTFTAVAAAPSASQWGVSSEARLWTETPRVLIGGEGAPASAPMKDTRPAINTLPL